MVCERVCTTSSRPLSLVCLLLCVIVDPSCRPSFIHIKRAHARAALLARCVECCDQFVYRLHLVYIDKMTDVAWFVWMHLGKRFLMRSASTCIMFLCIHTCTVHLYVWARDMYTYVCTWGILSMHMYTVSTCMYVYVYMRMHMYIYDSSPWPSHSASDSTSTRVHKHAY